MTNKRRKRKLKTIKWGAVTWLLLLIAFLVFAFAIYRFPLMPGKWKLILIAVIALIAAVLCYFSLRKKKKEKRTAVSVINSLLAICLIIVSILLPGVSKSVDEIFADFPETNEVTMNVYALTTQYKSDHAETFRDKGISMITDPDLLNYKNKEFITQKAVDQENQAWTISQIKELYGTDTLWENSTDNIWSALNALYNGDGDALVLNAAYVSMITEQDRYSSFTEDTIILKTFVNSVENNSEKSDVDTASPFAVLIAGSDSRDAALSPYTRTDVDIIAVVDPADASILLVSLPRDTYIANPALNNGLDKLTHMGVYGIENTCAALSQFLNFNLTNYMLVNFNTYESIVNTLGGVDIVNPYQFSTGSYTFPAGNIHLSGEEALAYVRERHNLSGGDFDRNEHQIIVLKALIRKMLSTEVITRFSDVMASLSGTFLTNVSTDSIYELAVNQVENMRSWTITARHIDGSTGSAECASAPGELLSVVYPDQNIVNTVSAEIREILGTED